MKKFISLAMVSVLAMSAVSCGSDKPTSTINEPTNQTTSDGTTEVDPVSYEGEILIWMENEDWAEATIEGFNEIYPNIDVSYQDIATIDQRQKLELDGPSGIGPDIIIVPHDHIGIAINDGLLEPLSESYAAELEEITITSALETTRGVDGKVYGAPITTENIALFYNKDIYGETAPTTFDEIIEFSRTYNDPANNKFALRFTPNDSYSNFIFLTAFGYEIFGENHDDYTQLNLDSPEVIEAVTYQNSLREIFDVNCADATWDETVAKFQNGESAFAITGPWALAEAKKNGINFGVAKIPTINGVQPSCFSGNIIGSISAFSENKQLAELFLQYLTTTEGASVTFNVTGKMPALTDMSAVEGLSSDPYLMGIAEQSPYSISMPTINEMALAWGPLGEIYTFSWDGELTPEEACKKAMETYELLLNTTGKSIND